MGRMSKQAAKNQAVGIARAKRNDPAKYAGRKKGTTKLRGQQKAALMAEVARLPKPMRQPRGGFDLLDLMAYGEAKKALAEKYGIALSTLNRYLRGD